VPTLLQPVTQRLRPASSRLRSSVPARAMNEPLPCVRLRPFVLALAVACILLLLVCPVIGAVIVLANAAPWIGIIVTLGATVFVPVAGYAMSGSNQWVELGGDVIRVRRLLTRKIVEYRVADIVDAQPIHTEFLSKTQNAMLDFLLDTSNRGYQLFFRDGSRIPLIRADMCGLEDFLAALTERMRMVRESVG
jgi:hypothetical protein